MLHSVLSNSLSYQSVYCTSAIIRKLYEKKFTCLRTNCEPVVLNVLAAFSMQQMCEDLNSAKYSSLMMEISDKCMKFVPVLIRHFTPKKEI
jgi:hypothetical protein